MTPLTSVPRLIGIARVLLRYRLDDFVEAVHLFRPLKWVRGMFGRPSADIASLSRGARLRMALAELGPIFVKFGQILSTRRDLLPPDIADELTLLQDQVPPFPGDLARKQIEQALGAPIMELYAAFDETPLASASIAQVHAAQLKDGREVVIKVLRPASASALPPTSRCCTTSPAWPNASIRTPTRSARAKSSPRSKPRWSTNSTCNARAPTPVCCGAISATRPISTCPRCTGAIRAKRC